MENRRLSEKAINGMMWRTTEMLMTQGMQFAVSIILARLIIPAEYGVVAIIMVFISLATTIINGGFGTALIQKMDVENSEFNTVFTLTFLVSILMAATLILTAPLIAGFYELPEITLPLRVLAASLIIDSVISIQQASLTRELQFKLLFFRGITSTCISGAIGVALAYIGYGVWALISQQLAYKIILEIILLITVKWRPTFGFAFSKTKPLFYFGGKMLVSNLATAVSNDLRSLVIGKRYSAADLGFYHKGKNLPSLIVSGVNSAISTTMFPIYTKAQTDAAAVRGMVRRSLQISSYLIFPMMAGLAAIAYPLIELLLTEKWIESVPYLIICCVMFAIQPMTTSNLQAFSAIGESGVYLRLTLIRQGFGILVLLVSIPFGVKAIAISAVLDSLFGFCQNILPNKKLLGYSFGEYVRDFLPATALSTAVYLSVEPVIRIVSAGNLVKLSLGVLTGVSVYIAFSYIFKVKSFLYLRDFIRGMRGNKQKT